MNQQNGLLDSLCVLREEKSRSISPENFTGEKGRGGMAVEGTGKAAARELGQPCAPAAPVCRGAQNLPGLRAGAGA